MAYSYSTNTFRRRKRVFYTVEEEGEQFLVTFIYMYLYVPIDIYVHVL